MGLVDLATEVVIKEGANVLMNIIKGFDFVQNTELLVGIPDKNSGRSDGMTNAQLMYLHTYGSPVKHIPARPVIEPALAKDEVFKEMSELVRDGMVRALAGDLGGAQANYEKAGMVGAAAAQDYITSGSLAPNAPATIRRKGSSQPLIDTGALRQSITYVVRRK